MTVLALSEVKMGCTGNEEVLEECGDIIRGSHENSLCELFGLVFWANKVSKDE